MDADTTLAELRERVRRFVAARKWQRYHTPKDLSMAIAVEAAELMELFQWMSGPDSARFATGESLHEPPPRRRPVAEGGDAVRQVRDELADVLILCFALANAIDIGIADAVTEKLALNDERYPVR